MARHLTRLRNGLEEALELDLLDQGSLQLLQPKSPAINMTAAMQFSMGTRQGEGTIHREELRISERNDLFIAMCLNLLWQPASQISPESPQVMPSTD